MNKSTHPPKLLLRFLRWFCHPDLLPYIEGDLIELFEERVRDKGVRRARWLFVWDVVKLFRPGIIRPAGGSYKLNHYGMMKNNLKVAWRHFNRERSYTAINIVGLTVGILCATIIGLVIQFELSYDDFHAKGDRIYRVLSCSPTNLTSECSAAVPQGIKQIFEDEFPEIQETALLYRPGVQLQIGDELISVENAYFTTPSFFELFDFKWKTGSPRASLAEKNQAVVDARFERDFFGGDALGKRIRVNNEFDVVISGVIEEFPPNSEFNMRMAISYATFEGTRFHHADYSQNIMTAHQTYVLLKKGTDPESLSAKFSDMVSRYLGKEVSEKYFTHRLQPLNEVHYDTSMGYENFSGVISKKTLRNLGLIGFLVLLAASINYINLSTANAIKRSKEVAIRKIIGSSRYQLISQFLLETSIIAFAAGALSLIFASLTLPYLQAYLNIPIEVPMFFQLDFLMYFLLSLIAIGLVSGLYPAFILARFKPFSMIKPMNNPVGGISLRRVLVILQIGLSQGLIICAIIAARQIYFFNTKDLGFDKEAIVTTPIPIGKALDPGLNKLKADLLQYPEIKKVSLGLAPPSSFDNKRWTMIRTRSMEDKIGVQHKSIDEDYFDLYDLTLLAGQNVRVHDSIRTVVINETLMKQLGITNPQDALTESIDFWSFKNVPVVGVVKNFVSTSLKEEIPPLFFWHRKNAYREISVKIDMARSAQALGYINHHWKEAFPDQYFEFSFVDEDVAQYYQNERTQVFLVMLFTMMAIAISALGLFGMVSFLTTQRMKEMGIRKILGATAGQIVFLFSKEFVLLIGIAFLIAAPIAFHFMREWLSNFAFRIELSWWIFGVAALISILLTAFSIGVKSVKTATISPVETLKDE